MATLSRVEMEIEGALSATIAMELLKAKQPEHPFDLILCHSHQNLALAAALAGAIDEIPDLTGIPMVLITHPVRQDKDTEIPPDFSVNLMDPVRASELHHALTSLLTGESFDSIPQAASAFNQIDFGDHPPRILLVEDNVTNQEVAANFLKKLGISVDTAGNGHECLKRSHLSLTT
jgi:hypothetical protein